MQEIDVTLLRELLKYDPENGELYWKTRNVSHFKSLRACNSWNTRYAGLVAGTVCNDYITVGIFRKQYYAHRIIWAMVTGSWPENEIDHRDEIKFNNRWLNLREATRLQNMQNIGKRQENTSGLKGVSWHSKSCKWYAQISHLNKTMSLGLFDSKEEAFAAYSKAAKEMHGEFINLT